MSILLKIADVTTAELFREPVRQQFLNRERFDGFLRSNQPGGVQACDPIAAKSVAANVEEFAFPVVPLPFSDHLTDQAVTRVLTLPFNDPETALIFVGRSLHPLS